MRSISRLGIAVGVLCLGWSQTSWAKENRWTHFGLRPLGMGNAYVAVADDYNALFYNPAGLARLEEWKGEFFNPTLEAEQGTLSAISDLMSIGSGGAEGTSKVLETLEAKAGKIHHFGASMTPYLVSRGWGLGLGLATGLDLIVHSDIDIELAAGVKAIVPISYAMNFLDDRLSLGATLKMLYSAGVDDSFNIQTISAFSSASSKDSAEEEKKADDVQETKLEDFTQVGAGYGVDLGLLFTPIKTMEPTIGISITDLGGSAFAAQDLGTAKAGAPPTRLPSVNTGISFKPIQTQANYLLVALDAHSLNRPIHYSHKLNLGVEYGIGDILKLQSGLKEGYLTAGMQFDVRFFTLRFATYVVDHAPVVGTVDDLVERRFAVQFKLLI